MPKPPNPAPDPPPNSTAPTSTPKKPSVAYNPSDYPSFAQRPTANPLAQKAKLLTNPGWALKHLGLTEKDVADVPEITPRVKEAMGSVKEAISLLRGDDSPDSLAFIAKWDSMSERDQKNTKLEYVIVAAQLSTRRFMELLAGASFDHSATVSKIFVSRSQLKVMKATVKAATDQVPIQNQLGVIVGHTNGDVKAMEIFHKITGALPTPKGSSFILNQQINAQSTPSDTPAERTPLESMDSFLLEMEDVRKPRQLGTGAKVPIIPVEMPDRVPEIEYLSIEE